MNVFKVTKQTPESNSVIIELNAKVLTSTFKTTEGVQKADLYTYEGTQYSGPKEVVAYGTCSPIMGVFVETIDLVF